MSPIRLIILIVAAGSAVLAGYLVFSMSRTPPQVEQVEKIIEVPKAHVLVARRQLPVGTLIVPEDLDWAPWPEANLNPSFLTQEDNPDALEEAAGWVVRTQIFESEPVLPQKVIAKGETGVMAALVDPGMRAIAVEISAESASSGFILPEDKVDVILTYEIEVLINGRMEDQTQTVTILQNVRVLSIDQQYTVDPETGQNVILGSTALLQLAPGDAELLALGESLGVISLSLRSASDALESGDTVISKRQLFDLAEADEEGPTNSVRLFRRGEESAVPLGGG